MVNGEARTVSGVNVPDVRDHSRVLGDSVPLVDVILVNAMGQA